MFTELTLIFVVVVCCCCLFVVVVVVFPSTSSHTDSPQCLSNCRSSASTATEGQCEVHWMGT